MKLYIPKPIRNKKSQLIDDNEEWKKVHNVINRNDHNDDFDDVYYINISSSSSNELSPSLSLYNEIYYQSQELINYNKKKYQGKQILKDNQLMEKLKQKNLLKKGIDIIANQYIKNVNSEKITFQEKKNYNNLLKYSKYSRLNHIYYLSNNLKNKFFVICKKKFDKYINYAYIKDWSNEFPCHIIKLRYFYAFSFFNFNDLIN